MLNTYEVQIIFYFVRLNYSIDDENDNVFIGEKKKRYQVWSNEENLEDTLSYDIFPIYF